ncbi:hypothetical protein D3C86_1870150 [compost metagenome]
MRNRHMTKGHAPERLPDYRAVRRQGRIARFFCYTVLVERDKTSYNLRPSSCQNMRIIHEHSAALPQMRFRIHLRRRPVADLPGVRP